MTKTKTTNASCPATYDTTGCLMQRISIVHQCAWQFDASMTIGAIDAPEWIPIGATCAWGPLITPRSDLC